MNRDNSLLDKKLLSVHTKIWTPLYTDNNLVAVHGQQYGLCILTAIWSLYSDNNLVSVQYNFDALHGQQSGLWTQKKNSLHGKNQDPVHWQQSVDPRHFGLCTHTSIWTLYTYNNLDFVHGHDLVSVHWQHSGLCTHTTADTLYMDNNLGTSILVNKYLNFLFLGNLIFGDFCFKKMSFCDYLYSSFNKLYRFSSRSKKIKTPGLM